jgi:hypothetical protein
VGVGGRDSAVRAVLALVALGGCAAPEVALAPVSSTVLFPAVAVRDDVYRLRLPRNPVAFEELQLSLDVVAEASCEGAVVALEDPAHSDRPRGSAAAVRYDVTCGRRCELVALVRTVVHGDPADCGEIETTLSGAGVLRTDRAEPPALVLETLSVDGRPVE